MTDRRRLSPDARTTDAEILALERFLDGALDAGVDAIQIRERDLDARVAKALVARVAARAGRTVILVNDRADIALSAGAGGVHLRADSVPTGEVRRLVAPDWTIGRSVHSSEEAEGEVDADYVLFGTVFPTESKPGAAAAAGLDRLQAAAGASHSPVIAIGGITPERALAARRAGAAGVAAIGVFLPPGRHPSALGVREGTRALKAAMQPR